MLLSLYDLATLRSPIPSDPRDTDHLPDPGTPSLAQGRYVFFSIFTQINSHVTLPGAAFAVPLRTSTRFLASPRQVASFNASAMSEPDTQGCQTLKTHHTHLNNWFLLIYWCEKDNLRQSWHRIPWKRLVHFNIPLCTWTLWLAILGQLYSALEQSDWPIQVYYLIPIDQFKNSLRTSLSLEWSDWIIQVNGKIFLDQFKNFFPIQSIWLTSLSWSSNLLQSDQELLHFWAIWLDRSSPIVSYSRFSLRHFLSILGNLVGQISWISCTPLSVIIGS